jgi:hypothetical protein
MSYSKDLITLDKRSLHPPALDAGDDEDEIPSVLLEYNAYVADRRNDTTAVAHSTCGREVQVSFFAARPPRVSYLCVFCRPAATEEAPEEEEEVELIPIEPQVLATDENLVLLRIAVSPDRDIIYGDDLYIYRPAGGDGPSLTRLPRPPSGILFDPYQIGILSCHANRRDDHSTGLSSLLRPSQADQFYMVAALSGSLYGLGRGRFVLDVYNSKLQTWTVASVSVEDQHFQKYQEEGYLLHTNTKVIAVGGDDATIAFVDLWRGILLCDLSRVEDKPCLRYVPLPEPSGSPISRDARLSRDIAVVNGHFKLVQSQILWKGRHCSTCSCRVEDGWKSAVWTRPVSASALLDDSWQLAREMESSGMDVETCSSLGCFELLPKLVDDPPFGMLDVSHPALIPHPDGDTVCFMVKINRGDAKAWVIAVDTINNRLQGVAEFDAERYTITHFSYLHTRISKYLNK